MRHLHRYVVVVAVVVVAVVAAVVVVVVVVVVVATSVVTVQEIKSITVVFDLHVQLQMSFKIKKMMLQF